MAKRKENILAICAHNDDQVIGAGGTLAKYARQGKRFYTIIFSYGELSHPHLKEDVIIKRRVNESLKADKILGGSGVEYLGLHDKDMAKKISNPRYRQIVKKIIEKKKPVKIFTHAPDDPHPLHRAVHRFVKDVLEDTKTKAEVYSFDIWNPIKIKERDAPKLVVDITGTFKKKIKAFKANESQEMTILTLLWNVYLKAIVHGWNNQCKYAEVFYRIEKSSRWKKQTKNKK